MRLSWCCPCRGAADAAEKVLDKKETLMYNIKVG